ncbi:ATP-binding protein [bacterium]|nr:MAG: ATP-binding protein [bacterium]
MDPKHVLQKTICGLLNRRGGRIYLGVHDNKTIRGVHLTPKQRDDLKLDIQSFIKPFEPDIINSEAVSIVFIPVKQHANSRPIPGLFVVKIIVKQGDPSQLYSVQKRFLEC